MISPPNTFKNKIIHAGLWTFGGHFFSQAIRLLSNLIMTRLLVPEMFGLMSIVSVLLLGLVLITDVGLKQNIVQSKRAHEINYLNTVWTFQVIRGLFIWFLSVLMSAGLYYAQKHSWIAANTVYADTLLPFIIPVATFSLVFSAFEPTWTSIASRDLKQAQLVKIEIISQLAGVSLMVVLAYIYQSIWSLVIGSLMASLAHVVIVSFLANEKRNSFYIEKAALHDIFHFGKWIFMSSIIGFLYNSGDKLLLGGLINPADLGVYSIASFIVGAVYLMTSKMLGNVAFPALSETARNKPEDLIRIYYKFRIPFDAFVLFIAGFFLLTGQTIIDILYDSRYQDAGWMLSILGLSLIPLRYNLTDQCILALGKPKLMSYLIIIRTLFLFILLPIAFKYFGMIGALWIIVLSWFSSFPLAIYYKKIYSLLDVKKELITLPLFAVGLLSGYVFNLIYKLFI